MTADEAIRRINIVVDNTITQWGKMMLEVAESANTNLKDRIINTGYNAEGRQYDPYSTTPMLANCKSMTQSACSKVAGSKTKRKDLKWVTLQRGGKNVRLFELAGGYKEFRELHGRQTGFVDFAFSGRMWAGVQIVSSDGEHANGIARISTLSDEQMKKLEGNTKRKGVLLDLNQAEIDKLAKIVSERLTRIWQQEL